MNFALYAIREAWPGVHGGAFVARQKREEKSQSGGRAGGTKGLPQAPQYPSIQRPRTPGPTISTTSTFNKKVGTSNYEIKRAFL